MKPKFIIWIMISILLVSLIKGDLEFNYEISKKNGKTYVRSKNKEYKLSLSDKISRKLQKEKRLLNRKKKMEKRKLNTSDKTIINKEMVDMIKQDLAQMKNPISGILGPTLRIPGDISKYFKDNKSKLGKNPFSVFSDTYKNHKRSIVPGIIGGIGTGIYFGHDNVKRYTELKRQIRNYVDMKDQEKEMSNKIDNLLDDAYRKLESYNPAFKKACDNLNQRMDDEKVKLQSIFQNQEEELQNYLTRTKMVEHIQNKLKKYLKLKRK